LPPLLQELMKENATMRQAEFDALAADEDDDDFEGADIHEELIEFPIDGSNLEVFFWVLLFPLRLLMHFTLPDVRSLDKDGEPTATIGKAFFATFMCLVWLVVASYAMVASLEAIAALMDIPDAVIGFTVSAAGTLSGQDDVKVHVREWRADDSLIRSLSFRYITPKLCRLKGCG
jgi:Ca2+/Na+ antiporter